ncbi:glycosyltransferase family 17 protein [Bisporella sp. PMI_857]|nr:glycosyltransferase family 17 protein [Bisporella sp. PMI_857]
MLFPPRPRERTLLRRYWRRIPFIILVLYLFTVYTRHKHPFTYHAHQITDVSILFAEQNYLPQLPLVTTFCAAHNFDVYPRRQERKTYDLVMLNNELDWLEIRLNTMSNHVSYFIILESPVTFTGLKKDLIFTDELRNGRFKQWKKQILYTVVQNMPVGAPRTWDLEDYQRNALLLQGVNSASGPATPNEGDVLIVADMDELIRPAALMVLRNCDIPPRVTLRSKFYYYSFKYLHIGPEWAHPQATLFRGASTILPADLRNGEGGNRIKAWWDKTDLWNAGWHCSSCFEKVEDMLNKMKSFSHTSLNAKHFQDKARMVERVRTGKDLWDREGEMYERIEKNQDMPEFLKGEEQKKKFGYLLDRDGPNAGFTDYKEGD